MTLSILYVAPDSGTSLQRRNALEQLGHEVTPIDEGLPDGWLRQIYRVGYRFQRPPDLKRTNRRILDAIRDRRWDMLWVDKGLSVMPKTLETVRRESPETSLVAYSPDDCRILYRESLYFQRTIPLYDAFVTTKSYNVEELRDWGASNVFFVDNAYCPDVHRPITLSDAERSRFACDIGFVGHCEEDRAMKMLALARAGLPVVARGPAWKDFPHKHENLRYVEEFLDDEEYPRAINATSINLGFLRKAARDLQTTRSIEIPACGAFMLAERTTEHQALFEEGKEAEFFGDADELIEKCRYYLAHPAERERVAAAGLERCRRDRYDNVGRLAKILEFLATIR